MIVLGLDFETTGLDWKKNRVIEVGAVLWSTDLLGGFPITLMSEFCYEDSFPATEPEAFAAHGITPEMLFLYGRKPKAVFEQLNQLILDADAVIAHNGSNFDEPYYIEETTKTGVPPVLKTWIDTSMDVKYPAHVGTRKLTYLAAEHQFLNPFPHRAIFDVLTMLRVFQNYDADAVLHYARQPKVTLQALVSYDDRNLAKERGYRWSGESKRWLKAMRLPDVAEEIQAAPFKVKEVPNLA